MSAPVPGDARSPRRQFSPLIAQTRSLYSTVDPVAFDCVKIIVVRSGSAILLNELGTRHVKVGDVVVLASNTLCGAEPEGWVTTTTLYLDHDYVVDQVFWQYAAQFADRLDAQRFLETYYAEPAQILRVGEERAGLLMPWLDEFVALSVEGPNSRRFYRAQSLLFAILDVIVPYLKITGERITPTQRATACPTLPRHRLFQPLRSEARRIAELMKREPERQWMLGELAAEVHLSPSQLGRVFVDAFGKSPIAYLTMIRAERMAHLLRTTETPVAEIASQVGWADPNYAARQFRRSLGVAPRQYRALSTRPPNESARSPR